MLNYGLYLPYIYEKFKIVKIGLGKQVIRWSIKPCYIWGFLSHSVTHSVGVVRFYGYYRFEEYINKNCILKLSRACFYKPFFIFVSFYVDNKLSR